jgi:hypothetical protein
VLPPRSLATGRRWPRPAPRPCHIRGAVNRAKRRERR